MHFLNENITKYYKPNLSVRFYSMMRTKIQLPMSSESFRCTVVRGFAFYIRYYLLIHPALRGNEYSQKTSDDL